MDIKKLSLLSINEGTESNPFILTDEEQQLLYRIAVEADPSKHQVKGWVNTTSGTIQSYIAYRLRQSFPHLNIMASEVSDGEWEVSLLSRNIKEGESTQILVVNTSLESLICEIDDVSISVNSGSYTEGDVRAHLHIDAANGIVSYDSPTTNAGWLATVRLRFIPNYVSNPSASDYKYVSLNIQAIAITDFSLVVPENVRPNTQKLVYVSPYPSSNTKPLDGHMVTFAVSGGGMITPTSINSVVGEVTYYAPDAYAGNVTIAASMYLFGSSSPFKVKTSSLVVRESVISMKADKTKIGEGETAKITTSDYPWDEMLHRVEVVEVDGITEEELLSKILFDEINATLSVAESDVNDSWNAKVRIEAIKITESWEDFTEKASLVLNITAVAVESARLSSNVIGTSYRNIVKVLNLPEGSMKKPDYTMSAKSELDLDDYVNSVHGWFANDGKQYYVNNSGTMKIYAMSENTELKFTCPSSGSRRVYFMTKENPTTGDSALKAIFPAAGESTYTSPVGTKFIGIYVNGGDLINAPTKVEMVGGVNVEKIGRDTFEIVTDSKPSESTVEITATLGGIELFKISDTIKVQEKNFELSVPYGTVLMEGKSIAVETENLTLADLKVDYDVSIKNGDITEEELRGKIHFNDDNTISIDKATDNRFWEADIVAGFVARYAEFNNFPCYREIEFSVKAVSVEYIDIEKRDEPKDFMLTGTSRLDIISYPLEHTKDIDIELSVTPSRGTSLVKDEDGSYLFTSNSKNTYTFNAAADVFGIEMTKSKDYELKESEVDTVSINGKSDVVSDTYNEYTVEFSSSLGIEPSVKVSEWRATSSSENIFIASTGDNSFRILTSSVSEIENVTLTVIATLENGKIVEGTKVVRLTNPITDIAIEGENLTTQNGIASSRYAIVYTPTDNTSEVIVNGVTCSNGKFSTSDISEDGFVLSVSGASAIENCTIEATFTIDGQIRKFSKDILAVQLVIPFILVNEGADSTVGYKLSAASPDNNRHFEYAVVSDYQHGQSGYDFKSVVYQDVLVDNTGLSVNLPTGSSIFIRNNKSVNTSDANFSVGRFVFTMTTGSIKADGNIMSLLYDNIIKSNCFRGMFYNCKSLIVAPDLNATTLAESCYREMFFATGLTNAPALPAETAPESCYHSMFMQCKSLTSASRISATTLGNYCCQQMFQQCTALTTVYELLATTLSVSCYQNMFMSCTSLVNAPEIFGKSYGQSSCQGMFWSCERLANVPDLHVETTSTSSCYNMFNSCYALVTAPKMDSLTKAAAVAFCNMFNGCRNLKNPPALKPTTLDRECYSGMFQYCSNLEIAPELPATMLGNQCYMYMFYGSKIKSSPSLPATTLKLGCYQGMFFGCGSLDTIGEISATTLANNCCENMFKNCGNIVTGPTLKATSLASNCYSGMFENCTKLTYVKALFTTEPSASYTNSWLNNTGSNGTFVASSAATWVNTITRDKSTVPSEWNINYDKTWGALLDLNTSDPQCITHIGDRAAWSSYREKIGRYYVQNSTGKAVKMSASDSSLFAVGGGTPDYKNGNIMVIFPQVYYKGVNNSDGTYTLWMSEQQIDGYYQMPLKCVGAYYGFKSNGFRSYKDSWQERQWCSTRDAWALTQNISPNHGLMDYEAYQVLVMCYINAYNTLDVQSSVGIGVCGSTSISSANRVTLTGATSILGDSDGVVDTGKGNSSAHVSLFGIEDLWGSFSQFLQGVYYSSPDGTAGKDAYVYSGNRIPDDTEVTSTTPEPTTRIVTGVLGGDGYITKMVLGERFDLFPTALGGSSTTYYADQQLVQNGRALCMFYGGNGSGGLFSRHRFYSFGHYDAYIISRLAYYGDITYVEPNEL